MSFQCTVVTPEQQVMDETVTQAILPAHDGQLGVLTNRAPILVCGGTYPAGSGACSSSRAGSPR
jgi:hypothetical protein